MAGEARGVIRFGIADESTLHLLISRGGMRGRGAVRRGAARPIMTGGGQEVGRRDAGGVIVRIRRAVQNRSSRTQSLGGLSVVVVMGGFDFAAASLRVGRGSDLVFLSTKIMQGPFRSKKMWMTDSGLRSPATDGGSQRERMEMEGRLADERWKK